MPSEFRAIEDFKWCIQSPPLMQFEDAQCWPSESWFKTWNLASITTPELTEYKLGLRFEAIVSHWIDLEPSLNLLAKNLVVHDGNRTIGEFDLIVENNGTVEHWELAIKFYLGTGDVSNLDNWHGPDPSDTLARKINRMESHQLRLSHHPAGKKLLEKNNWDVRRARSLVKGRLFHPYQSFSLQQFLVPPNVNSGHEKGWWLTDAEFALAPALRNARFVILERSNWLAPLSSAGNAQIMNHQKTVSFLSGIKAKGTIPIAQLTEGGKELSRGFVAFPQWLTDIDAQKI
tara:strand:- start:634 stop:1497 length:864 start_codon:yes stop_codon:yes gene_type:complete